MSADLVIVGAGPAGVSAALWAGTFALTARLIERGPSPGGQLHRVHFHPAELPGIATGDGPAIAATFAGQLAAAGTAFDSGVGAVSIEPGAKGVSIGLADGRRIGARAALIATGLRRRRLGIPGERELAGRGVSYSARRDRDAFANRDVVVIGGGDGALENALLLAEVGCRVTVVARDRLRARPQFRERVAAEASIEVIEHAVLEAFSGRDRLESVRIARAGNSVERAVTAAVIKIGMIPNAEWCDPVARDEDGYVTTTGLGRTSLPRVWAAGDVTRPFLPSVVTACGNAATAVADIRAELRGS